jgi:hypothetical protein
VILIWIKARQEFLPVSFLFANVQQNSRPYRPTKMSVLLP